MRLLFYLIVLSIISLGVFIRSSKQIYTRFGLPR